MNNLNEVMPKPTNCLNEVMPPKENTIKKLDEISKSEDPKTGLKTLTKEDKEVLAEAGIV